MNERPHWRLLNDGEEPPAGRYARDLGDGRRAWFDDSDDEADEDEASSLLDVALTLAAAGLPVFPCAADKRPAISKAKGGNGFHDASTDPDRIRELWELAGPAAQLIGSPTGGASGFDALDFDPRHGSDNWRAANIHRLPETRIHGTPGLPKAPTDPVMPGEHWLFRHVDGVRNIQDGKTIAPGIDVRGTGGYICFPPSDGYRVIHEAEIAPWPDWLLSIVLKASEPAPRPEPSSYATPAKVTDNRLRGFIDREVRRVRDAPIGGRHGARLAASRSIGGVAAEAGLSDAEAEEMLIAARPPEVEEEKERRTIRDGLAYGRAAPIDLNTLPDSAQFHGHRQHHGNGAAPPPLPDDRKPPLAEEPPPELDAPPPPDEDAAAGPGLPVIVCRAGELPRMFDEAEAALLAANVAIYQRGVLVRPAEVEYPASHGRKTHSAALIAVTGPVLTKLLSQAAIFMKFDGRKNRNVVCDPPAKLVDIILASRGDWRFPVVRGVLTSPTLRPDGSLLTTPGYDKRSRYYLMFPSNLVLPPIPDRPTRDEALASLARLNALLDGYPFADPVSRAVALSLQMTQVLRCAMTVCPMHAISATAPCSGKSHLVDLCSHIAIGRFCPIMGPGKSDEETEKGINTKLISGTPAFSIDNVHHALDIPALNIATERPLITIRVFGTLTDVEIENAVSIYMTGNNLPIIDEQMRRTVRCVLDAEIERPELRPFPSDPIEIVMADRGRYVADILVIVRAYLTGGTRPDIPPLGSYADWSRFVREPLVWLGQPDPVKSMETLRQDDPATLRLQAIIDAWHIAFGMGEKTLAEAASYATTVPIYPGSHADPDAVDAYNAHREAQSQLLAALREAFAGAREGIDTSRWGQWMRKFAGRIAGGLKFVKDTTSVGHHGTRWRLSRSVL